MANPETGYFTRSNDGGVEAYVAQSADKTTLTFYYDDQTCHPHRHDLGH